MLICLYAYMLMYYMPVCLYAYMSIFVLYANVPVMLLYARVLRVFLKTLAYRKGFKKIMSNVITRCCYVQGL